MLKVVCGGLYSGMISADGGTELKDAEPPIDWLDIIYRGKPFPEGFGLYSMEPQGDTVIKVDQSICNYGPLILQNERGKIVHGLMLQLFGFRFNLLATGPQPRAVDGMSGQSYRPNGCVLDGAGTRVSFAWDSGPGSTEVGMRFV